MLPGVTELPWTATLKLLALLSKVTLSLVKKRSGEPLFQLKVVATSQNVGLVPSLPFHVRERGAVGV